MRCNWCWWARRWKSSAFVFEMPTGVVADVFSRRLSIIIGMFVMGLGFVVEGSFPFFAPILLAQVLWGLGYTFTSGATEAWIADEVGEARSGQAFLRASQIGTIGSLIGIGPGTLIGLLGVNIPIVLGGALLMALGAVLIVIMPETGFKPAPRENREYVSIDGAHLQERPARGARQARADQHPDDRVDSGPV